MANKFIRGLVFSSGSTTIRASYMLKFMYEFWGYCIYSGSALAAPTGFAGNTTIAPASNGASLPTGTINVVSTTGFPSSGTMFVQSSTASHLITYTGVTATTFTGCTGGNGTLSTGGVVSSTSAFGGSLPLNFNGIGTVIAAGSNGQSLPQATINVISTTGFPSSGTIFVYTNQGTQTVTYTGTTATTFTGCSGGSGTMSTNNNVTSSTLMTLGNDGYTNATLTYRMDGYTDFYANSAPFTSNMVGKQLVMWKAGSNSSEDSIYNIIAVKSPSNIVLNINTGGTPSVAVDGYRPSVTTRTSINYRVVDIAAAATATGVADNNFIIFQLDPTGINVGQANSQIQYIISTTNQRLDFRMSPNGSWTGSAFGVDASGTLTLVARDTASFFASSTSGQSMSINLIGDKSFLIGHIKDSFGGVGGSGAMFHMEIPERLYTQTQDPNPLAMMMVGYIGTANNQFASTATNHSYGGGFNMRCNDGVYRLHRTTVKAMIGDGDTNLLQVAATQLPKIPGNALVDIRAGANVFTGTLVNSSGFLTLPGVAGQYSLARVRLRNVRFANSFMKIFTRFSALNDWILLTQGVAVPWDKTVLPITIFPV